MTNTMNFLKIRDNITDTMISELYGDYFNYDTDSFTNPLVRDVEDLYNKIVSEFPGITNDQEVVLKNIFEQFKYVQEMIDPNRLQDFSYKMTDDDDLILSRNNDYEAINLIIHPEEDFALSIIHKENGNSLNYFDKITADYESIVYSFLK